MGGCKMLVYAFLGVKHDKLKKVVNDLRALGGNVKEVHFVYGEYDLIAELSVRNPQYSLKTLNDINNINGVTSLKTYVVSESEASEQQDHLLNSKIYF